MKVVIIGNGVAGVTVAKELAAKAGRSLEITIVAKERYPYYARVRLPELLSASPPGSPPIGAEDLALFKPSWYAERGIKVILGVEASGIDREGRRALLSTGESLDYDALVLALGAEPVRPELPGSGLEGVLTLRDYDDALKLRESALARPRAAAVIGGGLLGLEAAWHLKSSGVAELSVLELAPYLLPRQLDERGAAVLTGELERRGIRVLAGARLLGFEGEGRLEGIAFDQGGARRSIAAGTALVSMGARPRTGLARAAGLLADRGIVVDGRLRTSDPAIYAVGDCAEFEGRAPGIVPVALEEASHCAAAILGNAGPAYAGTISATSLKVAGIELFSAGEVEGNADDGYEEFNFEPGEGRYERYLVKDGALAGAIVIGSRERAREAKSRLGAMVRIEELEPEVRA